MFGAATQRLTTAFIFVARYNMRVSVRIVFMGSPEFSQPSLLSLSRAYPVVGVVTQPDRPAGRGKKMAEPPVKTLARSLEIDCIQPARLSTPQAMEALRAWAPDLVVVAAFGQILRPEVLGLPKFGCINVHASLLPRWRGASPINAAILHGDLHTGITIMKMDEGLDTGPILSQESIRIEGDETAGELSEKLADLGAQLLIDTLPGYLSGEIAPLEQDGSHSTYAPMLQKGDGRLDFLEPAEDLRRKVLAFNPWPGAFIDVNETRLKVHRAGSVPGQSGPGTPLVMDSKPAVGTGDGILVLEEVQPAGKRPMPGNVFLNGFHGWEQAFLGG